MQRWFRIYALILAAALCACAQGGSYTASEASGNTRSGITVYGEIDTSIGSTR